MLVRASLACQDFSARQVSEEESPHYYFGFQTVKIIVLTVLLAFFPVTVLAAAILLYCRKAAATGEVRVIGQLCQVNTNLSPYGTVVVQSELWQARSVDGSLIHAPETVRIVGSHDHLLLVARTTVICD